MLRDFCSPSRESRLQPLGRQAGTQGMPEARNRVQIVNRLCTEAKRDEEEDCQRLKGKRQPKKNEDLEKLSRSDDVSFAL